MHLLGVVLLLAPLPLAHRGPFVRLFQQKVPGAVINGDDVPGHLAGLGEVIRGRREFQLAHDLPSDGVDALSLELIYAQCAARRQTESHNGEIQSEEKTDYTHVHLLRRVQISLKINTGQHRGRVKRYQTGAALERERKKRAKMKSIYAHEPSDLKTVILKSYGSDSSVSVKCG